MEPKDEIKERLDIVDLIGSYLELKPAGSGSFKAVCPFHAEKSPSFYVSRDKEIWHCFGCDKGGDIFSFVMDLEGMSFPEALRLLGKRAGVEIPEYRPTKGSNERQFLLDMNVLAVDLYQKLLWEHDEGKVAREYLAARGIDEDLAKTFRLGCAPDRWDALVNVFRKRSYSEDRLVKAGLAKKRRSGQGVIDQFRNRLLIPLCDGHGNVLGFTGRQLDADAPGPKYLNTPETPIYHKSNVLFGLDLAKTAIRHEKAVIIVEGNLDVVASHKAGVKHVVASSGTALTEDQLRLLKKVTGKLLFCFDADAAGFAAAKRGIGLAQTMGFDINVITIPKSVGKDPDDVVQKDPEAWKSLVAAPVHIMQYYLDRALTQYDIATSEGKREFVRFLLEEIAQIQDPIERDHWLQRVADVTRTDIQVLRSVLGKPTATTQHVQPSSQTQAVQPAKKQTKTDKAAAFLIGAFLHHPHAAEELVSRLAPEQLPEEPWARIYKKLVLLYTDASSSDSTQNNLFSQAEAAFQSADEDVTLLRRLALEAQEQLSELSREQVRTEVNRHIELLSERQEKQTRETLLTQIREAERSGDTERLQALLQEYSQRLKADSSR